MKILLIDIETKPNLGYIWSLWNQNVSLSQLVEAKDTICFGYEWLEGGGKGFHSVWGEDGKQGMVQAAWDLLNEADAVIHYNGSRFDMPHLNALFFEAKMGPPSPYKNIDLLSVVRKKFGQGIPSKKLAYVTQWAGLTTKTDTGGFGLWIGVMKDDPKAQKKMERYCRNDVKIMRPLYYRLLPWIDNHPNRNLYNAKEDGCPKCDGGPGDLVKEGFRYTQTGAYQQYSCRKCKGWCSGGKRSYGSDNR